MFTHITWGDEVWLICTVYCFLGDSRCQHSRRLLTMSGYRSTVRCVEVLFYDFCLRGKKPRFAVHLKVCAINE